jgi:hypothetical protein
MVEGKVMEGKRREKFFSFAGNFREILVIFGETLMKSGEGKVSK